MLQEGFAEAVSSKKIKLRIVKELKTGYRNEAAIEDDVLYLQVRMTLFSSTSHPWLGILN